MDEQKKNNEDSVEQPATHDVPPVDNATQNGPMYGQTQYVESRPPEPDPTIIAMITGRTRLRRIHRSMVQGLSTIRRNLRANGPSFCRVADSISHIFATVGIGFVLFGHIVDGKPTQTTSRSIVVYFAADGSDGAERKWR